MAYIAEPITKELAELPEWKRNVVWVDLGKHGNTEMVTADFHRAFVAELQARYERNDHDRQD